MKLPPGLPLHPPHFSCLEIFLLFFLLFGRSYLDTKQYTSIMGYHSAACSVVYRGWTDPQLYDSSAAGYGDSMFPFLSSLEDWPSTSFRPLVRLFLAIVPAMILTRENYQPARYFLFANLFLILGVAINYALDGLLPWKTQP